MVEMGCLGCLRFEVLELLGARVKTLGLGISVYRDRKIWGYTGRVGGGY